MSSQGRVVRRSLSLLRGTLRRIARVPGETLGVPHPYSPLLLNATGGSSGSWTRPPEAPDKRELSPFCYKSREAPSGRLPVPDPASFSSPLGLRSRLGAQILCTLHPEDSQDTLTPKKPSEDSRLLQG